MQRPNRAALPRADPRAKTRKGQDSRPSSIPKKEASQTNANLGFCPSLQLSVEYTQFKKAAFQLAEVLRPMGLSISSVQKSIICYKMRGRTFPIDSTLAGYYQAYLERRADWDSFRDSFRASRDAESVETGLQGIVIEQTMQH